MKKALLIMAAALMMLCVSCKKDDDKSDSGGTGDHAYVDLGLPSGLLWATCNVGADSPEDYGGYWSGSLSTDSPGNAYDLNFDSGDVGLNDYYRLYGQSVRPVCPSQK